MYYIQVRASVQADSENPCPKNGKSWFPQNMPMSKESEIQTTVDVRCGAEKLFEDVATNVEMPIE
jgi:hypothetical protein